jgi:hypothetical protein
MCVDDLTSAEFEHLLGEETASLQAEARAVLDRYAVAPFRVAREFEGRRGPRLSPVWVVARDGDVVLGYDEVEEEYGIGRLRGDGPLEGWGTFGERVRWSLVRFPDPAEYVRQASE